MTVTAGTPPTIGLVPWGNVIEDFLEPAGLTLERFLEEFTGSWMFSWARALLSAGIRTEIVCVSRDARAETQASHRPTGTPVLIMPTTRAYRLFDRRMAYPYGSSVRQVFAQETEPRGRRRLLMELVRQVGPYTAIPPMRLLRAARRHDWRAILCQEYEDPRFDVSVLLGRVLQIPVFASFQGGTHQYGRLERIVRRRTMALSTALIVGPERESDRVRASYGVPRPKIARIPNPIDLAVWRPHDRLEARGELGLPRDARVVAWHGRIAVHHKGIDVLLEAWRKVVSAETDDVRLLLIGGGSDAAEVDRLIGSMRLPGVVRVDRHIHDPELLSRYLSAADAYVLASRYEGFPVAMIEAMGCALPVVATDVAGVREIVGEGDAAAGLIVPTENPEALAAGLVRVLADPALRATLARRARAQAEARFSLEAVGAQLRDILV